MNQKLPVLPKFKGPFFHWEVEISTDRNKSTSNRFLILSSGRRGAVFNFLWLKFLWDQLTKDEYLLFLSLPETLKDDRIFGFLQNLLIFPKKLLRKRLNNLENNLGLVESSRKRYLGTKRLHLQIHWIERNLPKVAKYSGYVKSPSSVGSKRLKKTQLPETAFEKEYIIENQINWFYLLSVDEIPFFKGNSILKSSIKNETENL